MNTTAKLTWIIDTGTFYNMCREKDNFSKYFPATEGMENVSAANGTVMKVQGYGIVSLATMVNGKKHVVKMKALHIPDLESNLISTQEYFGDKPFPQGKKLATGSKSPAPKNLINRN